MDSNVVYGSLLTGFGIGISTMVTITLFALPMSYAMNKFIYHGPVMRAILGIIAGVLSIVAIIVMVIFFRNRPVHYFGLAPLVEVTDAPVAEAGYLALLWKIFNVVIHPILFFYNGETDLVAYKENISGLLISEDVPQQSITIAGQVDSTVWKGAVCETFFKDARELGAESDVSKWNNGMASLGGVATQLFNFNNGSDAGAVTSGI